LVFSDTIGGSSYLDVNSGFGGGIEHVSLYLFFAIGLGLVFSIDTSVSSLGFGEEKFAMAIPALVAVAVGVHGFGEGAAFSTTAASTSSESIIDAFGGLSAGVAYVIHKALEPMMIGACYFAYSGPRAQGTSGRVRDMALLSTIFVIPATIGAAVAYFLAVDTTFGFALGTGTSIYAAVRLLKPVLGTSSLNRFDSVKIPVALFLGFTSIYIAALFHS